MVTLKFHPGPWSDLLSQIQIEGCDTISPGKKYVFLYICANWSLPCRKMETETLSNQLVGDFFNANFLCIRVLVGIMPEADTRKKLSEVLAVKVEQYPLCLFLDQAGKVLHEVADDLAPIDLINEAKTALGHHMNSLLGTLER